MYRFALFLLIVGGALVFISYREWDLAADATEKPQEIKLADLIARGPQGNAHLTITDFTMGNSYVFKEDSKNHEWKELWVVLVPRSQPKVMVDMLGGLVNPKDIKVLMLTHRVKSRQAVESFYRVPLLTGMLNSHLSLGAEERRLLSSYYPGIDIDRCLFFEEGKKPWESTTLMLMFAGGSAALVIGVFLLIFPLIMKPGDRVLSPSAPDAAVPPPDEWKRPPDDWKRPEP